MKRITKKETTNRVDMWDGDELVPQKYGADAYFSDADGVYRGNIYCNDTGKIIGDYSSPDSRWIEKTFQISWNAA